MESRQRMVIIRVVSIPGSTRKKPGVKRYKSTLYAILFKSRSIAFGIRLLRDLILSLAAVNNIKNGKSIFKHNNVIRWLYSRTGDYSRKSYGLKRSTIT